MERRLEKATADAFFATNERVLLFILRIIPRGDR